MSDPLNQPGAGHQMIDRPDLAWRFEVGQRLRNPDGSVIIHDDATVRVVGRGQVFGRPRYDTRTEPAGHPLLIDKDEAERALTPAAFPDWSFQPGTRLRARNGDTISGLCVTAVVEAHRRAGPDEFYVMREDPGSWTLTFRRREAEAELVEVRPAAYQFALGVGDRLVEDVVVLDDAMGEVEVQQQLDAWVRSKVRPVVRHVTAFYEHQSAAVMEVFAEVHAAGPLAQACLRHLVPSLLTSPDWPQTHGEPLRAARDLAAWGLLLAADSNDRTEHQDFVHTLPGTRMRMIRRVPAGSGPDQFLAQHPLLGEARLDGDAT